MQYLSEVRIYIAEERSEARFSGVIHVRLGAGSIHVGFGSYHNSGLLQQKPREDSKVTFGVVYRDRLNNTNNGIPQKSVKDEKSLTTRVLARSTHFAAVQTE